MLFPIIVCKFEATSVMLSWNPITCFQFPQNQADISRNLPISFVFYLCSDRLMYKVLLIPVSKTGSSVLMRLCRALVNISRKTFVRGYINVAWSMMRHTRTILAKVFIINLIIYIHDLNRRPIIWVIFVKLTTTQITQNGMISMKTEETSESGENFTCLGC